ncbi:MAG: hypothetical protein J6B71_06525, partial [Clostridia bacterium]|nr:hypothetical protein [Clostridia bacterium]
MKKLDQNFYQNGSTVFVSKISPRLRLILIRMFTVGAIIDRPQTTAKPKRATNGRPYKRISAEILFSLPICV